MEPAPVYKRHYYYYYYYYFPPVPDHKGFKWQYLLEIHPLHFQVNFQKFSTLRVKIGPLVQL